ncbi:MAG: exported protein of unknown function [Candidatus Saccharibacteria bacterium]|nr:exported protein of unknown function [Candidatus Saccharibacteria bacterium]
MGKLFTILRNAPKRLSAIVAVLAVAVIVPAALHAWGPDRPTYTIEQPADHVTFNSITNNPNIGDERNFVGIRESGTSTTWTDNMNVEKGKEYTVRVYVHNNAAANLNKVAQDVTAKVNLPTTTGKSIQVDGLISSSNASPTEVWDQANFKSNEDFNLAYVAGSLKFENNAFGAAGTAIPESVFTNAGAKLGYDKLDGKIPGCFQYAGYLTFKVKPQFAPTGDFTMSKEVSKHGANKWSENYEATPGETVDYLVEYKNTGEAQQDNVVVKDALPAGVTYVNDSTVLGNALNPAGIKTNNGVTTTSGINVGSYKKGGNAWVIFSAKVGTAKELICGKNTLVNKATVVTGYGTKEDTANVVVNNECKPNECKPGIPMGDKRCEDTPVTPVTPTTPSTPAQLPTTGPTETILSILGLGSLIAGISYYIVSRRALLGR